MALANMRWTPVTWHHVVAEFLRAERNTKFRFYPPWLPVIDSPNLVDAVENHQRSRLLHIMRGPFIVEIPRDTAWYEVEFLTHNELNEIYVGSKFNPQWDATGNRLDQVALIAKEPMTADPANWARVILWGHDNAGPFTILEGNHRLLGYAYTSPPRPLKIAVYVGLSPSPCFWHYADPPFEIANDLWNCGIAGLIVSADGWIRPQRAHCP
jgi:hypothetical protein